MAEAAGESISEIYKPKNKPRLEIVKPRPTGEEPEADDQTLLDDILTQLLTDNIQSPMMLKNERVKDLVREELDRRLKACGGGKQNFLENFKIMAGMKTRAWEHYKKLRDAAEKYKII